MKLAIIGMGNMGSKYAAMILDGKIPDIELAAVTRIGKAGQSVIAGKLPPELPIYQSAEELFAAFDKGEFAADAALIVTPHTSHAEIACAAFARGLSVLCDKPAGVCSCEACRMQEAYASACEKAERSGKQPPVYGFMFQQRTFPIYQKIRQLVQSGQYGNVRRVDWVVTDWYRSNAYYASASWRGTWKSEGGGILLNQCPHNLDLLQWICGLPARVQAFCHCGKYHPIEVEDDVTAYLEWANGATGTFVASTGEGAGVNRLEISLDNALIVCENGSTLRVKVMDKPEIEYRLGGGDLFAKPKCDWVDIPCAPSDGAYEKMLSNFAAAHSGLEAPLAPGKESINSLLLSNGMYLSSWQKRMVELPAPYTAAETAFEQEFLAELRKRQV